MRLSGHFLPSWQRWSALDGCEQKKGGSALVLSAILHDVGRIHRCLRLFLRHCERTPEPLPVAKNDGCSPSAGDFRAALRAGFGYEYWIWVKQHL